ncbi:hypothetical protein DNA34_24125, partial [Salmonella enterica subsp. enterica serovar Tennessee]|nr:hypothetical protein [Salmonella enterica subsp. enterica serovar Tennessee]MFN58434.1 hypothetical protein [Salmonella enterica subsp. enterica serovar Meleagridis]
NRVQTHGFVVIWQRTSQVKVSHYLIKKQVQTVILDLYFFIEVLNNIDVKHVLPFFTKLSKVTLIL